MRCNGICVYIFVGPHSKHPLKSGRGLVLELPSGECIFSANEICRLSCEGEGGGVLGGQSPEQRAVIDYWLDWECSQLKVCERVSMCVTIAFIRSFHSRQSAVHSAVAAGEPTHDLLTCLSRLESHLSLGHQYLIPEGLSLADVVVWSRLYVLLSPDTHMTQGIAKCKRTLILQPSFMTYFHLVIQSSVTLFPTLSPLPCVIYIYMYASLPYSLPVSLFSSLPHTLPLPHAFLHSFPPPPPVFHKDHPLVCQWFISLARLDPFTSAQWKDSGTDSHLNFILAKTSQSVTDSRKQTGFSGVTSSQPPAAAKGTRIKDKSTAQAKKGESKGKGQSSKGQPTKNERPSQQPVSGL